MAPRINKSLALLFCPFLKKEDNKPEELSAVVNEALDNKTEKAENAVSGDS